jgi:tRNA threonylcarbamoyladenosine biosynthesis protein TsaB
MKLLALDTASAQCSVALLLGDELITQAVPTAREHAQLILPMLDALLAQAGITLRQLDGIAFGRGPGSFTGVRVAAGVTQGLALGADLPVWPVSDLRALAAQALRRSGRLVAQRREGAVLACMDARMGEIYGACYAVEGEHVGGLLWDECVCMPDACAAGMIGRVALAAGMGLAAYPQIALRLGVSPDAVFPDAEPHAQDVARLAALDLQRGARWQDAATAMPVYLRDQVVQQRRAP